MVEELSGFGVALVAGVLGERSSFGVDMVGAEICLLENLSDGFDEELGRDGGSFCGQALGFVRLVMFLERQGKIPSEGVTRGTVYFGEHLDQCFSHKNGISNVESFSDAVLAQQGGYFFVGLAEFFGGDLVFLSTTPQQREQAGFS